MSDTYKTSKARQARVLYRNLRDKINSVIRTRTGRLFYPEVAQDMYYANSLRINGVRFGNNRKWKAKEKVRHRKSDRRKLSDHDIHV